LDVTSTQVSRAAAELDEHIEAWPTLPEAIRRGIVTMVDV